MDRLFLGVGNHVVCINKRDGQEIWRTKVKSSSLTNVYYEDNVVYAYSGGHLFSLHANTGEIAWENKLKGLGYGACIIASEQQASAAISAQIAAQQSGAAAGAVAASAAASSGS